MNGRVTPITRCTMQVTRQSCGLAIRRRYALCDRARHVKTSGCLKNRNARAYVLPSSRHMCASNDVQLRCTRRHGTHISRMRPGPPIRCPAHRAEALQCRHGRKPQRFLSAPCMVDWSRDQGPGTKMIACPQLAWPWIRGFSTEFGAALPLEGRGYSRRRSRPPRLAIAFTADRS